jgi:hypothetical protein
VIEVEDILRVIPVLQRRQPGKFVGPIGPSHPVLSLVGQDVHVDAVGERLEGGAVTTGCRDPLFILCRIGPAGGRDEFDQHVAMGEGGLVVGERGDGSAVGLEGGRREKGSVGGRIRVRCALGQERIDGGIGKLRQVVPLPVPPLQSVAMRVIVDARTCGLRAPLGLPPAGPGPPPLLRRWPRGRSW